MKILISACTWVVFLSFAGLASATDATLSIVNGTVVSEEGVALADADVQVNGRRVAVSAAGEFEISVPPNVPATYRIEVSADGYYPALQTVHRSDFASGQRTLPPVQLVARKPGRQLLLFAGDAMLSRRYFEPRAGEPVLARAGHLRKDARALLSHVKPYVEIADFASVNLETQLSSEPLTTPLPKSVTFYSPPELAEALQWAGFDYVALGNNHMYDFQSEGLDSTLQTLDELQLAYSGGDRNDALARKPALVSVKEQPYGLLSYVGWAGGFKPSQVAENNKGGAALGDARRIADDLAAIEMGTTSVVQLHSGIEYSAQPSLVEQTIFHSAVAAGGDVMIGHHAHVLQGLDIVDERLIAYSLGNFLFDQYIYTTQMGMLLYVWMDGEALHRAEVVPMHVNGYTPTPATGEFRYAILHRLAKLSNRRNVCLSASGLHMVAESCSQSEPPVQEISPDASALPVALRSLGVSPLHPVRVANSPAAYRLGVDLLRRGESEHVGLFGTVDRTWIENDQVQVLSGDKTALSVRIEPGAGTAQAGLKVFDRVFAISNPATVSGRIHVEGDLRMRVSLQRRRTTDSFSEALVSGPITPIGEAEFTKDGWHEFSFDYAQPRLSTRGIRFLIEFEDASGEGVNAELDDVTWVEWRTPWLRAESEVPAEFATHFQLQQ